METYLRNRGITALHEDGALRFHPRCYYRPDEDAPTETWPAMIARVTDLDGRITGAHRTWLDPSGRGKAPIDTPRRAMGDLLGNAVRFGVANDVLAAGEGIETMLSLRCVLPTLPMAAALSANHLAAMLLPLTLRRLYIARDADAAGDAAVASLIRARRGSRHRGDSVVASTWRLQRGSAHARLRRTPGSLAYPARAAGRHPLHAVGDRRDGVTIGGSSIFRPVRRGPLRRTESRPWPSRGRSDGKRPGPAMAAPGYFPPALRAFAARNKIAGLRHPPLALRPSAPLRVLVRSARRLVIATKAAMGAVDPAKDLTMTTDHDDTEFEPPHSSSPTDHVLNELQLYGYRPFHDEPDPRPLPEGDAVAGAVADIFDALVSTLSDTRLEPDLEDLLWSTVNLFHRATDRIERELDDNEQAQRKSQREQNGSEVRSVELERLTAEGITLIERRNSMELFRDQAAERFEVHTGSPWRPAPDRWSTIAR